MPQPPLPDADRDLQLKFLEQMLHNQQKYAHINRDTVQAQNHAEWVKSLPPVTPDDLMLANDYARVKTFMDTIPNIPSDALLRGIAHRSTGKYRVRDEALSPIEYTLDRADLDLLKKELQKRRGY